jgi:hypothetical protein
LPEQLQPSKAKQAPDYWILVSSQDGSAKTFILSVPGVQQLLEGKAYAIEENGQFFCVSASADLRKTADEIQSMLQINEDKVDSELLHFILKEGARPLYEKAQEVRAQVRAALKKISKRKTAVKTLRPRKKSTKR